MEKLIGDIKSGSKIKIKIKNVIIGDNKRVIISGPCTIENYDIMLSIGKKLKDIGVDILRGGAFKPRTSPYTFQGLQWEGLKILKSVGEQLNMPVVTEIMDTRDVEKSLDYTNIIQIGSRNMYNYNLLKEVGKTKLPIILKRGMSASISEWIYAAEYIMAEGNLNVILCERGIRTFESYTRNTLDLNSVAVIKQKYRMPIIVDTSHGTGLRELVPNMSLAAVAAGADGIMIESHINPEDSISDARQTVSIDTVKKIKENIEKLEKIL
ncbi:phospho-2-dehydro-3-deoxyheptonate aldolase [Clostridium acetireducens DSM 10703]|uniref:Phospho-2-dehydro-3-deoxyheptonate aldolase n=1 Tax=Clostridium acetireducens DSM 10703 TaxID=1121290 RepID=A0A1E8F1P0_9CLOT|nr:3-deoxy-7-phosphoheptulonate synthase [Clostridium acetireducens]OFI07563.1 phospho-2-dehydro-3-deoxyheptonate aldolase [Clostridium acetireducens DSM 10703]